MDRKRIKESFELGEIPTWHCPTCDSGYLSVPMEQVTMKEDAKCMSTYDPEYNDPPRFSGIFTAILTCSNQKCSEHVIMSGYVREKEVEYEDPELGWGYSVSRVLSPRSILPPLRLIDIPARTPKKVEQAMWSAFDLIWCDPSSCANKVRVAVELLMDHFKVKKYSRTGARKPVPLHSRIDVDFRVKYPLVADHLLACKWIGNEGSHVLTGVSFKQALDGIEMLEYVLAALFDEDAQRLTRLATKINRKKRPV